MLLHLLQKHFPSGGQGHIKVKVRICLVIEKVNKYTTNINRQ